VAPRDPVPGRRFRTAAGGRFRSALAPDAERRSLNANLVLRWEYRPGSFLTVVWNHQRDALSHDVTLSPGSALARLAGDPPTNVLLSS